jgi:hypothetical protein
VGKCGWLRSLWSAATLVGVRGMGVMGMASKVGELKEWRRRKADMGAAIEAPRETMVCTRGVEFATRGVEFAVLGAAISV